MKDKERIINLQKQLSIAMAALKEIDNNGCSNSRGIALDAIEKIEHIQVMKLGMK